MVAEIKFPGYGVLYESGFSTDVSETCVWMTPFWIKPADVQDLM